MAKRNYAKEYREYHAKPKQKKRRAARNKARREAERKGQVSKGDGKDVHHKDRNPQNNSSGNKAVISRKANRGRLRTAKNERMAKKRRGKK